MSGSTARLQAIDAVKGYQPPAGVFEKAEAPGEVFGQNVFTKSVMQSRLPKPVFKSLMSTIENAKPLDLTYMEYELLKFFATHSSKVFTREQLLSRVWGYEYYGGARTVDVHVRRLRAKLGEEHANLIQTVRSVGYRFGTQRWSPTSSDTTAGAVTP